MIRYRPRSPWSWHVFMLAPIRVAARGRSRRPLRRVLCQCKRLDRSCLMRDLPIPQIPLLISTPSSVSSQINLLSTEPYHLLALLPITMKQSLSTMSTEMTDRVSRRRRRHPSISPTPPSSPRSRSSSIASAASAAAHAKRRGLCGVLRRQLVPPARGLRCGLEG